MKITNRKQRRKAEQLGVLHEVSTLKNKATGNEAQMLVIWGSDFTPVLVVIENDQVIYEAPAVHLVEHISKLTNEALVRFKETLEQ